MPSHAAHCGSFVRAIAAGNLVECERQVKPGHVAFRVQCQFAHVFAGMRAYEFACFL